MRKRLKSLGVHKMVVLTGVVYKIEEGTAPKERKIMVKDIRFKGKTIEDHLWLHIGQAYAQLDIKESDYIRFKSRIQIYVRRNLLRSHKHVHYAAVEYGVGTPIRIEKITKEEHARK